MKHLSGLDASFLYLETPEMPMHVGGLNLFELPANYTGDFYEDVKEHVRQRMHLAPVFQRKLATMPFELANPVWVDDEDIDLDYHIRRIVLKNGTMEQLEQYVGRLHSSLLDRSRPLWEFYVIEGLASGHPAFYSKLHHAGLDGAAGQALASAILDLEAEPRKVKPPRERRRTNQYQLGVAELFGAALSNTVRQWVKLAKLVPPGLSALRSVLIPERAPDGSKKPRLGQNFTLGPRTPLNVSITNQRAFATLSLSLKEARQIAKKTGTTLNDVVLAECSDALRRYLNDYDALPAKSLIAGVPVSLREAGNTEMNNQVSMMLVSLATDIKDPLERLTAINVSSTRAKNFSSSFKTVMPTDFPSFGAPWLVSGLVSLYGRSRIANVLPPLANVAISNVPGPQQPLYMARAKMLTYYPVSIPGHGIALNITVQSYNGSLEYGLTACRRAMPDVKDLAGYIERAHKDLVARTAHLPDASVVAPATEAPVATKARAPVRSSIAKSPGTRAPVRSTKISAATHSGQNGSSEKPAKKRAGATRVPRTKTPPKTVTH